MKKNLLIFILIFIGVLLIFSGCETVGLSRGTAPIKSDKVIKASESGVSFIFEAPAAQNVALVGEFNNWDVNANPMKNDGGTWKINLPLASGTYMYKFLVNGTDWKTDPNNANSADDGYGGKNSVITVGEKSMQTAAASVEKTNKPSSKETKAANETKPVAQTTETADISATEFTFDSPDAKTVNLVGDFNNWDTNANPMSKVNGLWKLKLSLAPGSYMYKFFVNGSDWKEDPANKKSADDGYGGKNSVLDVGTKAVTAKVDSTPAKAEAKPKVAESASPVSSDTFPVKFEYKPLIGGNHTVFLVGDFNTWSTSDTPMIEKNGNYEKTLNLKKGKYGYKFFVDGNWITDDNAKDFADDGYGGKNSLVFAGAPADVNALRKVTFTYQPKGTVQTVYLVGSFNAWNQTATKMDKQTDGSYQTTLLLKPDQYTYKFMINGTDWTTDMNAKSFVDDGFGGQNSVLEVNDAFPKVTISKGDGEILTYGISTDQSLENVNPISERQIEFKTKAHMNDVDNVDVQINKVNHPMKMIGDDGTFSYYRYVYDLKTADEPLSYEYIYYDGNAQYHLMNGLFMNAGEYQRYAMLSSSIPPDYPLYKYPSSAIQPFYTPDWAKNGIIYQIFPERFANGNTANDPDFKEWYYQGINIGPQPGSLLPTNKPYYHLVKDWYDISGLTKSPYHQGNQPDYNSFYGGDIAGVENHLNYLQELGITIIYFNPITQGKSNHKYDATDYLSIDPHFGTEAEFKQFVQAAHRTGIRIIIDVAYNHTGETHWAFQDGMKKGKESPYFNWYEWKKWPMPNPLPAGDKPSNYYDCWWGFGEMPNLNYDLKLANNEENSNKDVTKATPNTAVVDYVLSAADYWIGKMDIDGFRLDVPNEVPFWFWEKFRTRVKTLKPDAYLVGEIWTNASDWVNNKYFDSVMNYAYFRDPVQRFIIDRKTTAKKFDQELKPGVMNYPVQASQVMMNLIDSHDTYRFLESAKGDVSKLKLAALFQMTWVGTPNIWYGDEIGMMGAKDPDCRRPFNWKYTEVQKDVALRDYYRKIIAIRKLHPALRTGTIRPLVTDGMVYGFLRNLDNENIIVLLNNDTKDVSIDVPVEMADGNWTDELNNQTYQLKAGKITIPLSAMGGSVLVQKTGTVTPPMKKESTTPVEIKKVSTPEKAPQVQQQINKIQEPVNKITKTVEQTDTRVDNIYFDSGSTQLSAEAIKILTVFISRSNDADLPFHIKLVGHTDNQKIVGSLAKIYPTNWDLSVARCTAVANYLIAKGKIDPKNISIIGMSDTEPANVKKFKHKDMNDRRVELLITE